MMNINTLKKLGLLTAAFTFSSCTVLNVSAEEDILFLEPGQIYETDVNADGTVEQLSFETYADETDGFSKAVLKVYLDESLVYEQTEEEWSYNWSLDTFTLEDGNTYLLACSQSDNDWNEQALVLSYSPESNSFQPIADLAELTRESEELTDYIISTWGRCFYVTTAEENSFTVAWMDTLMSTGVLTIPVAYEITDGVVSIVDQPCELDSESEWTVWHEFDTYTEPGSSELAFHVSADEIVSLTEMIMLDGVAYVKCVNQNGAEGWYADPEKYVSGGQDAEGNYLAGYFKEALFAG